MCLVCTCVIICFIIAYRYSVEETLPPFDLMRRVENGVNAKVLEKEANPRIKGMPCICTSLHHTDSYHSTQYCTIAAFAGWLRLWPTLIRRATAITGFLANAILG